MTRGELPRVHNGTPNWTRGGASSAMWRQQAGRHLLLIAWAIFDVRASERRAALHCSPALVWSAYLSAAPGGPVVQYYMAATATDGNGATGFNARHSTTARYCTVPRDDGGSGGTSVSRPFVVALLEPTDAKRSAVQPTAVL